MGLFKRRRSAPATSIVIDPCGYDEDATRLYAVLEQRDWKSAREFLRTVTDPDDRMFYMWACARVPGLQDWIEEWIAAEPEDTLPLLVRGARAVHWAWEGRGALKATHTSADQFRVFHQRLKLAENCLDEVVERDPGDATAWAFLMTSARGRQVAPEEARRRFDGAVAAHPHHVDAHRQQLQYLCRKWSGSHDEMFDFARSALAAAPDGTPLGQLVATAHLEMWIDLPKAEATAYITSPDVVAELNAAADRSVRHPGYRPRPGWPDAHNCFAAAFSLAGDHRSALGQFEILGDRATEFPWCYLAGNAARAYEQMRGRARAAA